MMPPDAPTQVIVVPPAPPAAPAAPGKPRRRLAVLAGAAVLLLAATGTVGAWWNGRAAAERQPAAKPPTVATAALVKKDLSNSLSLRGTLGYGPARTVKGGRNGVVTWLPATGTTVRRGGLLYRVDDQPVQLFYGRVPLFRTLRDRNMIGRDVRTVADNLAALGYSIGRRYRTGERVPQAAPVQPTAPPPAAAPSPGGTPASSAPPATTTRTTWVKVRNGEGVLTTSLIAAIKRWQQDAGLPVTGSIAMGDVAVLTGAVRVSSVAAQVGDGADAALLSVTGTTKVVSVEVQAVEAGSVKSGDKVAVRLPDDRAVPGRVTAVGTALSTGAESGEANAEPKLTVTVTVDDPKTVARFDSAELQVEFAGETHPDVLVAPVGALVALSEGGYAVQFAGGGLVAVETGMFAKGLVEISGEGLAEGAAVVTTS
jgi:hypothetical protein